MTLIDPQTYEGAEKKVQKVVYQGRELAAKTYLAVNLAGHNVDQATAARAELNASRQARLSKLKKYDGNCWSNRWAGTGSDS